VGGILANRHIYFLSSGERREVFSSKQQKRKEPEVPSIYFLMIPHFIFKLQKPQKCLIKSISAFSGGKILAHVFKCAFLSAFFSYRDRGEEAAAKEGAHDEEKLFRRSL